MNFEPTWTPTTYERIPYAPHNSTMHDERCSCPWCMPSEPDDLSDEEAAQLEDEQDVPHCHLCDETNKAILSLCQGCKKLVCPRHSLHPAVVLVVCDECVEAIKQAAAKIA